MNFFIEIINRLRTESPRFFIVLRWVFGVLGVLALVVKWAILREIIISEFADAIQEACGYILAATGSIWGFSFLPMRTADAPTDPKDPPPPKP